MSEGRKSEVFYPRDNSREEMRRHTRTSYQILVLRGDLDDGQIKRKTSIARRNVRFEEFSYENALQWKLFARTRVALMYAI